MPVSGAKPKAGPVRHRVKPVHEWVEVPSVPFTEGPALPKVPPVPKRAEAPAPGRPLGSAGLELWRTAWGRVAARGEEAVAGLLLLCEQADERMALRFRVLRDGNAADRQALRMLDAQVASGLARLAKEAPPSPTAWPAATKRWWRVVSSMPHCALWQDSDWQYALDTALIAAALHEGDRRAATELRAREKVLGTTADARRDLRIRYVEPAEQVEQSEASVTTMEEYRRMVGG